MIRLVIRGLLARKLRTILTSIAIILGVAMWLVLKMCIRDRIYDVVKSLE